MKGKTIKIPTCVALWYHGCTMVPRGFGEVSRVEMNREVIINAAPDISGGGTNAMVEMGRRKLVAIYLERTSAYLL